MTSNQLSYWRNEEEKRANAAREAETNRANLAKEKELERSNKEQERLKAISLELERQGLELKNRQALTELAELYLDKGRVNWNQLPSHVQQALAEAYGVDVTGMDLDGLGQDYNFGNWLSDVWSGVGRALGNKGVGNIIKELF